MARTSIPFRTAFDRGCRALNQHSVTLASDLEDALLDDFNLAYQIGYDSGGAEGWEDARVGSTIEPVDGLIDFDTLGDAREFQVWDEDPRSNSEAVRLGFTTDATGITLRDTSVTECWVSWIPETVEFVTTQWATATAYIVGDKRVVTTSGECYRCLVAHTSGTFADDLTAAKWVLMPVLAVLKRFLVDYLQGLYFLRNGQAETGYAMQRAAEEALETIALKEITRNARAPLVYTAVAGAASSTTSRYVRFDTDQSLSALQQLQALENIGVTIDADNKITFPGGGWFYLNAA